MIEFINTIIYILFFFLLFSMITYYSIYFDKVYIRNLQDPFDGNI